MTYDYYQASDGAVLVAQHFSTSGSIRIDDRRTVYSMAGSGKRVFKAAAMAFIADAKPVTSAELGW